MAEKLDEWSSHELADRAGAGEDDEESGKERIRDADGDSEHQLTDDVSSTKSWQAFEPQ